MKSVKKFLATVALIFMVVGYWIFCTVPQGFWRATCAWTRFWFGDLTPLGRKHQPWKGLMFLVPPSLAILARLDLVPSRFAILLGFTCFVAINAMKRLMPVYSQKEIDPDQYRKLRITLCENANHGLFKGTCLVGIVTTIILLKG